MPCQQTVIDRSGKLRTKRLYVGSGLTLVQLDWGWQVLQLGEAADCLLGLRPRSKAFPAGQVGGVDQLTAMLQVRGARELGRPLSGYSGPGGLPCRGRDSVVLTLLLHHFYVVCLAAHAAPTLRLSRNVLAQQRPWGGLDPLVNVEVLMALPAMVGMSITELSEEVRVGVGALAPATIQTAADAAAAADDDGDGDL